MFDFDAGKLIIIGIVALIVIGPKELPRVLRQLGQAVAKMRRMGAEFQNQFMDAMREAEVADIKADLAKLKESSKLDLPHFNPVQDLRREITAAVETAPALPPPVPPGDHALDHTIGPEGFAIEAPREHEPFQASPQLIATLPSRLSPADEDHGKIIAPPET